MDAVVFDQTKGAGEIHNKRGKFLTQDGHTFTFGAYDNVAKKWIPEPQYLEDFEEKIAVDEVLDLLRFVNKHLGKIADVLPALEMYSREAIARAGFKNQSFNKLKGELGAMKRELKKYEDIKKLASKKSEVAKLEKGIVEDGEQNKE